MNLTYRSVVVAVLAGFAGYGLHILETTYRSSDMRFRIMIDTSCEANRIELAFPDKTVVLDKYQISRGSDWNNVASETFVREIRKSGPFDYSLRVEFEGCTPIQGSPVTIDQGTLFYVWVTDAGVTHQVRA